MNIPATVLGYLGTACLVFSFQCKKESRLFLFQMLSGLLFVLHYGLDGDFTGMAMDAITFIRSLCMSSGKKALTGKPALILLIVVILILGIFTWEDSFSVFPILALLVSTCFLFTGNGDRIRKAQLFVTSPSWLLYNIHVLSIPGILCESLDMLSVIVYRIRTRRKNNVSDNNN